MIFYNIIRYMNIDSIMIWFELEPIWNLTDQELEPN